MSLAKASSPTKQMVDNIQRASRQSDHITCESRPMMSEHQSDPPSSSSRTLSPSNSPPGQTAHITKKKRKDYKEEIARAVLDSEYDNELGTLNQPIGGGVAKVPSDEDSKEARTEVEAGRSRCSHTSLTTQRNRAKGRGVKPMILSPLKTTWPPGSLV